VLLKNYTRFHVNVLEQGEEGELPIHAAIKTRNIAIIDAMLKFYKDSSLDINQKDSLGWTSLVYIN
jgi:ankyrin repeat protein